MIEYENFEEAQRAINEKDGAEFLTQTIHVDWAFSRGPFKRRNARRRYVHSLSLLLYLCHIWFMENEAENSEEMMPEHWKDPSLSL